MTRQPQYEPRPWPCGCIEPRLGCECGDGIRANWIEVLRSTAESHSVGRRIATEEIEAELADEEHSGSPGADAVGTAEQEEGNAA